MSQILIIDDDPTMRLTLSRLLKGQNFAVAIAKNGKEGLAKALELRPDLIICDWIMPEMDGLQVCEAVRQSSALANTYFILLTSRDQEDDIVQGLEAGADDFLPKPPRSGELKARIRAGLRVYNTNRELQKQKELLEQELAQAGQYVRSLLPEDLNGSVITNSRFIPSAQLGGDCFDFFWIDDDHLLIYLLDVAGHGVGSALLSVSVLNALRSRWLNQADSKEWHPQIILQELNQGFQQMSGQGEMYFTIWLGIYTKSAGRLDFSSAGHPPAFLHQTNSITQLRTKGIPVAMFPDVEYQQASCQIQTGDRLYLFSDGAYEIVLPQGGNVGLANLEQIIAESKDDCVVDQVIDKLRCLAQTDKFDDDFSIVEVQF
jgi:sigma-B regulation protein RsbU (phosphoserine phosphatase)